MTLGEVTDTQTLTCWLNDVLTRGSGWTDAVLLARGLVQGADLGPLADMAQALAASAERWQETRDQGAALAATVAAVTGVDQTPCPLPVAVAHAVRPLGLPAEQIVGLYLHAFASNLVSCAVRFIPLGQTQGQQALAALHPHIIQLARAAINPDAAFATSALRADVHSLLHETHQPRIFRT